MRTLALLALTALAACADDPQIHGAGTLTTPQAFSFRNFTELTVDAPGAAFVWEEYNVRDGTAFKPPYAELRVELAGGEVTATDRESVNGELVIAGTRHKGTRFRLHADGTVAVTSP